MQSIIVETVAVIDFFVLSRTSYIQTRNPPETIPIPIITLDNVSWLDDCGRINSNVKTAACAISRIGIDFLMPNFTAIGVNNIPPNINPI
jgi:hypothetical protein